jgi:predicted DNA-binding transcriptional regulator AlpA
MATIAKSDTESVIQRLLRLVDVLPTSGAKSPQQPYNWISENRFPKPIKIGEGRAVAWIEEEVCAWQQEQIRQRDAEQKEKTDAQG